jgi:hypothetical protein
MNPGEMVCPLCCQKLELNDAVFRETWSEAKQRNEADGPFHADCVPTPQQLKCRELAERYHREAEAYDRTVCTGPIKEGAIMPGNIRELTLINRHATALRRQLAKEAESHGITPAELKAEISRIA